MPSKSTDESAWAEEKRAVAHFKKLMLLVSGAAVKYQMDGKHDLNEQQEVIMNIADIGINTFIAESLLLRAQKLSEKNLSHPADVVKAITQLFISESQFRIQKYATDALMAFATGDELIIMLKGVKRFSAYPAVNVVQMRRIIADHLIKANTYSLQF